MATSVTIDRAFICALGDTTARDERAPALQKWHLDRMGPQTLAGLVHKEVGAAKSDGARAIMDNCWRLPRLAQAQVLEQNLVCEFNSCRV